MLFGSIRLGGFLLQAFKNLLNHLETFNTGNHFDLTATVLTDFDIDIENSPQSLHPGHGAVSLCGTLVLPVSIRRFWWIRLLAVLDWCGMHAD